jgi:predicted XRE-type DNA-binding protein
MLHSQAVHLAREFIAEFFDLRRASRRHFSPRAPVFADLGFPDASERQAKLRLAYALNQMLQTRKVAHANAAKVLGVTQQKLTALREYKLAEFSVGHLVNLLTALDQDVEIAIRPNLRFKTPANRACRLILRRATPSSRPNARRFEGGIEN